MGKVVLLTGASSGLGLESALYLTKKGYVVFGTSRNPHKLNKSIPFELIKLEITDLTSINACVSKVLSLKGKIDVLINNAGVGITGPLEELNSEKVVENFATNCFGPLNLIQAVLPHMRKQRSGTIINVTSIGGYMGLPFRGAFSASKSAFMTMTESLRMEVKEFGIKVCTLAPGDYATDVASRRYHSPVLKNTPYKKYAEGIKTMDEHVDKGNPPIEIAKAIYNILNNSNLKVHYRVGAILQKLSIFLKKILPSQIFERLIMNHYKL